MACLFHHFVTLTTAISREESAVASLPLTNVILIICFYYTEDSNTNEETDENDDDIESCDSDSSEDLEIKTVLV